MVYSECADKFLWSKLSEYSSQMKGGGEGVTKNSVLDDMLSC